MLGIRKINRKGSRDLLRKTLEHAGIRIEKQRFVKRIFTLSVIINLLLSLYVLYKIALNGVSITYAALVMAFIWVLIFFVTLFVVWLMTYLLLDLKTFKRRLSIEEVLPDYLQLTAANIRAGMTVDKALWHAVRPRFGVLAKEIETVAKEVMSGEGLNTALKNFSGKYDSVLLKRAIDLLIEGMDSGGELGEVLNKIASTTQETRILKKEMSADVTTYVIFIGFAVIVGAPMLLALSNQLLNILTSITSNIQVPKTSATSLFAISKVAINPADFKMFAYSMLIITSVMSASLVAIIKKGNIKEGAKYIPAFIIASVLIFILANYIMGNAFSIFFG